MAVRLFVGNLAYTTTEADLRSHFGAVAPPSQVVLPVDRETGRPRGFAFVEFIDRAHAEQAIQRFNGQIFNGRPGSFGGSRPFDSGSSMPGSVPGRSRNFGPDAKPQRGGSAKGKKKGDDKPRGPIPLKNTGRSFSLDDVDAPDEAIPEMDDIATSKPQDETDKDEES